MNKYGISIMLLMAMLVSCYSNSENQIKGRWKMYKVIQEGKDVTEEHNPYSERYLEFNSDSTFKSAGRPFGTNTGKYFFDENTSELFLDSDIGPEDDSYWKLKISNDTMYWQGYGSEWADNFQIAHIRS
jgi:hypothetical protein